MDIELVLGKECNLNCAYCHNKEMHIDSIDADNIPISTLDFLKRVPTKLTFYGGEPLMYWDHIHKILTEYYNPNCHYYLITNGYYLNKDIAKVLNECNVTVYISYDCNISYRGYDVIEENKYNIMYLNDMAIMGTTNSQDYFKSLLDKLNRLEEEYFFSHNKYFNIYIDFINKFDDTNKNVKYNDIANYDLSTLEAEAKYICDHYNSYTSYKMFLDSLKEMYDDEIIPSSPSCRYGYNKTVIDLFGNYYACLDDDDNNNCNIISNSVDDALNLLKKKDKYKDRYTTICAECNVRKICKNGCSYYTKEDLEQYYCPPRKAFYAPIIEFFKNKLKD